MVGKLKMGRMVLTNMPYLGPETRENQQFLERHLKQVSSGMVGKLNTLMCLSIGTPKNNKFSICSKWKIHYF